MMATPFVWESLLSLSGKKVAMAMAKLAHTIKTNHPNTTGTSTDFSAAPARRKMSQPWRLQLRIGTMIADDLRFEEWKYVAAIQQYTMW